MYVIVSRPTRAWREAPGFTTGPRWALLLLAVGLVSACVSPSPRASNPAAPQADVKPARVLSVVMRTEPFDLTDNASARNRMTLALFTANLLDLDQGSPLPVLAQKAPELRTDSWKVSPDGRMETTYQLRPGLVWHDGSKLSAEDVAFAYRATGLRLEWGLSTSSINLSEHKAIAEVLALDDMTIVIRWKESYAQAATPSLQPLPVHILGQVVSQGSEAFGSHPYWTAQYIGLGPYRLSRWEPGAFIEGTAFDRFALGRAKIDTVKVTWSADENATLGRLLAGDADMAVDNAIGFSQGAILRKQWAAEKSGVILLSPAWMRHLQIQFRPNLMDPSALADLRVRKAIAHGIDRQALVDALVDGLGIATDNIGSATSPYRGQFQQVAAKHPYDPRLVEQNLLEAGFSQGPGGVWVAPSGGRLSPQVLGIAEGQEGQETTIIVDMLRKVGIDAQLNLVSGAQIQRDDEMKSTFPALRTNYITGEDGIISRLLTSEIARPENRWGAKNKAGYASDEHDRLYDQWRRALDANERGQLMVQLIKFYSEQLPVIPTYIDVGVIAHVAALQGPVGVAPESTAHGSVRLWSWQ